MSKHFELTNETITTRGRTLWRIRATRDLPQHGVKAGDLGGFVESVDNLAGSAWVSDTARVFGTALVYGNARVTGDAWVYDNAQVYGSAQVYDNACVYGSAWVYDNAQVYGSAQVYDNAQVYGSAWVSDTARVTDTALVYDNARVTGDARVTDSRHVLTISPIGAENQPVTLCKTATGHTLKVGCWTGTADTLMEEVARRREKYWGDNKARNQALTSEYEAVLALVQNRIKEWETKK